MKQQVVEAAPRLLGLDASVWMNAIGIIVGLISVALITPWITRRQSARNQKEILLRTLLNTWLTPANPDYQTTLALIPLDYRNSHQVIIARQELLSLANRQEAPDDAGLAQQHRDLQAAQAKLIAVMAKELGANIEPESLRAGAYTSRGWSERDTRFQIALDAWPRIANALETSNHLQAQYIQAAGPAELPLADPQRA